MFWCPPCFYFECAALWLPVSSACFHQNAQSKGGVRFQSLVERSCIFGHVQKWGEQSGGQGARKPQGRFGWARSGSIEDLINRVTVGGGRVPRDASRRGPRVWWISKAPVVRIHWEGADGLSVGSVPFWELRWRSGWCLCKTFCPKTTMISTFLPWKKLRRNRYLLFVAILLVGLAAVYHEMVASRAWSSDTSKFQLLTQPVFGHQNFP